MQRKAALALRLRRRWWPIHNRCTGFAQMKMLVSVYLRGSNLWSCESRTPIYTTFAQRFPKEYHRISLITSAVYVEKKLVGNTLLGLDSSLIVARKLMPRSKSTFRNEGQIVLFPGVAEHEVSLKRTGATAASIPAQDIQPPTADVAHKTQIDVVLCGTFRKDVEGLKKAFEHLKDLGCRVLSPGNIDIVSETDGFVYMRGEEIETPERLEMRHLDAIQHARFVWLHAPEGYVGPTAALEVGFARACGVPVFSSSMPTDVVLEKFIRVVDSPQRVILDIINHQFEPPVPGLQTFQNYYRRAAIERGYESESAQNCLLLMMEEIGELARALRKREKLVRHGTPIDNQEALELADVFIYVVHMANILHLDLGKAVQNKEILNIKKTLKLP